MRQRQSRRVAEDKLVALNDQVAAAARTADEKAAAARRQREDAAALRRSIAEGEARRRELAVKASEGELARDSIPGAQALVDNFKTPGGLTGSTQDRIAQRQAALDKLKEQRDELIARSSMGDSARRRLAEVEGSLETQREALKGLESSSAGAAEEARKAALARDFSRQSAEAEAKAVISIYQTEKKRLELPQPNGTGATVGSSEIKPFQWGPGEISGAENERLNREKEARERQQAEARLRFEDDQILRGISGSSAADSQRRIAFERVRALAAGDRETSRIRRSAGISAGSGGLSSRLEGPRGLSRTAQRIGERDRASQNTSGRDAGLAELKGIREELGNIKKGMSQLGVL